MSETDTDAEVVEETNENGEEEGQKKRRNGRVIVLFIMLAMLLIIGGGAAAYFFLFAPDDPPAADAKGEGGKVQKTAVFYRLPDMIVNLNTGSKKKVAYLKVGISLELESEAAISEIELVIPRIVDSFQVYLRELRLSDLQGSAGLHRLKEELLLRLNTIARPIKINDVLFQEMLIQN